MKYLNKNWLIWILKHDSLMNWINSNYQELSGFIYNVTSDGAQKYIEAMHQNN
jgi:hypothetical protein